MHYIRKKLLCILLALCVILSCAGAVYAYVPSNRFVFIPIAYEGQILDALPCSEGLFAVKNESFKSGFIGTDGELKIPFDYADAGSFKAGYAPATVANAKYGYISTDGLYEIAPAFDSADDFLNGLALVEKDTKSFYIDRMGKAVDFAYAASYAPVGKFKYGVSWVTEADGTYRLLNTDGSFVNDTRYVWAGDFSDGVCWVSAQSGSDFLDFDMQLIDTDGNVLIENGLYTSTSVFSDGVCWAKRTTDNVLVLIDKEGNELLNAPDTEGMPTPYANGISIGLESGLFTVRNKDGIVIFSSLKYRAVSYGGFSEGCMLVQNTQDGKYYIMQDTDYIAQQTEETSYTFSAAVLPAENTDFEIAFRIDSPLAIVDNQKRFIDPTNANVKAYTSNNRTLVPMRFLSENLPGWSITWDYLSESAILKSDTLSASFKTGVSNLSYMQFNAEKKLYDTLTKQLDQPPTIADGRMFLPVRALSELMDVNVFYDERGLVVFSNTRNTLTYEEASAYLALFE